MNNYKSKHLKKTEIKNFSPSSKKHWLLIKHFEKCHSKRLFLNKEDIKNDGLTLKNSQDIADEFGKSLENTLLVIRKTQKLTSRKLFLSNPIQHIFKKILPTPLSNVTSPFEIKCP